VRQFSPALSRNVKAMSQTVKQGERRGSNLPSGVLASQDASSPRRDIKGQAKWN
jgi:hypothetical protein